eukprot:354469-Chlamydomonas_euryale.AAC.6
MAPHAQLLCTHLLHATFTCRARPSAPLCNPHRQRLVSGVPTGWTETMVHVLCVGDAILRPGDVS